MTYFRQTNKILYMLILLLTLTFIAGCELNPLKKLTNPTNEESLGNTQWGDWVIYDEVLKTGGDTMLAPGPQNQQIDFRVENQHPPQGDMCFKYSWNGADVFNYTENRFQNDKTSLMFIVDDDWQRMGTTYRNFSPGGYTKISFWAKGSLSANTEIVFSGPHTWEDETSEYVKLPVLTDSWKKYEIYLTSLIGITWYFKITFRLIDKDVSGNGGVVYLDDIRYTK